jgi:NADPH:quinone reductase-like Zn-dependent oxidoreductase
LNPRGIYVGAGGTSDNWMIGPLTSAIKALVLSWFVSQKQVMVLAKASQEDLVIMGELMASGKVTPVIDKRYSLCQVPDAIRYLEAGHARGKVVITLDWT